VEIITKKKLHVSNFSVEFNGTVEVDYSQTSQTGDAEDKKSKRISIHKKVEELVSLTQVVECSDSGVLQPGNYKFPFTLTLPEKLPASLQFVNKNSTLKIRYSLKVETKPKKLRLGEEITIMGSYTSDDIGGDSHSLKLPLIVPEKYKDGEIHATITTDCENYFPYQDVKVDLLIDNQTRYSIKHIRLSLSCAVVGKKATDKDISYITLQRVKHKAGIVSKEKHSCSLVLVLPIDKIDFPSCTTGIADFTYFVELECLEKPFTGILLRKPIKINFPKSSVQL